jgi:3-oxoacyl-[acyl-carrier protein] reductase
MTEGEMVVLITGAAQGIGKATAKKLGEEGYIVYVNDLNKQKIDKTVDELKSHGFKINGILADVSNSVEVTDMFRKIIDTEGRIDALVNNAGISIKKEGKKIPLIDIPEEQWDFVLSVNLKGPFLCTQQAAKQMIKQNYGRIVNLCSVAPKLLYPGAAGAHYCASKAALASLTKCTATDLVDYGIRVNAVAPGMVLTEIAAQSSPETNKAFTERIPMKRFANPEEIAAVIYFLLSEASSYITGEIIDINGGIVMD